MRKIRLGLDIDGCLYRWDDTARYLLKVHFGFDLGDSTEWDYIKNNITPGAWKWLWSDAITKHGLFRYGSIYKGSREFLERMEPYCDNVIITSRPSIAVRDTMDWLSYQKVPTAEVHIISTSPKSSVLPHCDLYIDDAVHNIQDLMKNTKADVIMLDRRWNQGFERNEPLLRLDFYRAYSWDQIEQILLIKHSKINAQ